MKPNWRCLNGVFRAQVLLIQPQHCEIGPAITNCLSGRFDIRCDRILWSDIRGRELPSAAVDLLLAVAVPLTGELANLFRQLIQAGIPYLGVFPAGADASLLRMVTEAADDFVLWPTRKMELLYRLDRLLGCRTARFEDARSVLMAEFGGRQLIGKDPCFLQLVRMLPRIADSGVSVLITGETGSGKELFARAIHHLSARRDNPFIPVDCAAVPEHLFENELFGHVRGAFTGARDSQNGLVAMAEGGTLFLDEIDSLSSAVQAKLLRFLEEQIYKRLGEERFRKANLSIIAACNQDLESAVREKRFRSDLWFRLNVLPVRLPPLRERRQDITLLAQYHLNTLNRSGKRAAKSFSPAALEKLTAYDWPGNIRELFNVVHRAAVLSDASRILPEQISIPDTPEEPHLPDSFTAERARVVTTFERNYIERLLRKHGGNITHAAREAGKERRAFGRLVKKYGISRGALF